MSLAVSTRAASRLRRLGLPGAVLLAALLCDLFIVATAVLDGIGNPAKDLLLLPGILVLTMCALLGRKHPVRAAGVAALTLLASTTALHYLDIAVYSTLLANVSFAETVAGIELVYLCVRRARPIFATGATLALVLSALAATVGRDTGFDSTGFVQTLLFGSILLVGSVATAIYQRRTRVAPSTSALPELVRTQWPVIGLLALPLFGEVYSAADVGPAAFPMLLCSALATVLAVSAARSPARAGTALAATILLSGVLTYLLVRPHSYLLQAGVPVSQTAAGMITVVMLVRRASPTKARNIIVLLSVAVAISSLLNTYPAGPAVNPATVRTQALGALLLLGISVAVGLFLRSRDSERNQLIRTAMSDAQTSERMALARELHDVVAHHVTGIVVQAQAAKLVGSTDSTLTRDAFDRIETSGTEALAAMRRLVGSMRGEGDESSASEQASTDLEADLRGLAGQLSDGVRVEFDLDVPADLPQEIARSALRVSQEALTNVSKHAANAALITVSAGLADNALHLRITDDGNATRSEPSGGSGGYGLLGMRERVELLGGQLTAGTGPGGGWCVEVHLPVEATT